MTKLLRPPEATVTELQAFRDAGYTLMPLKSQSKVPSDAGWRTRDYSDFDFAKHLRDGGNLGVRLGPDDLVLDVDPRNGGDESYKLLEWLIMGHEPPMVMTGGGGRHLYFKKPEAMTVRHKLDLYPGIDVKTEGGFVVAPGSVHPTTRRRYRLGAASPPIASARRCPAILEDDLVVPDKPSRGEASGGLSVEELRELLDVLDPRDYRAYDEWLKLGAAVHDAVDGDDEGRDIWTAWCARDPRYASDTGQVEAKWETFTAGREGGATRRTLLRAVADAGHPELVRAILNETGDDFEDDIGTVEASPGSIAGLTVLRADQVQMEPLNPLWPGRIFRGKLTTLAGMPDVGKTMVSCDIIARVTCGAEWPDGSGRAPLGSAIILSAEDDPSDTLVPRLVAAGAALDKVHILGSLVRAKGARRMFNLSADLGRLDRLIEQVPDVRVIFIDPINAYIGTSKDTDSFRDSDVRAVLGPLKEWAEKHEIAVVLITHFRKGGQGRAMDQVMGSLAFTALSRSSWAFIDEVGEGGEPTGRKLMAKIKQNVTEPVDAIAYQLVGVDVDIERGIRSARVDWGGVVAGSADALMGGARQRPSDKLNQAVKFLSDELLEGPRAAKEVNARAAELGIAEKTLARARQALGVESRQEKLGWIWWISEPGSEP